MDLDLQVRREEPPSPSHIEFFIYTLFYFLQFLHNFVFLNDAHHVCCDKLMRVGMRNRKFSWSGLNVKHASRLGRPAPHP